MWKKPLCAAIACFSLSLFIAPNANAACACMCVDGVSMNVCTGFVSSQSLTPECTAALECPAVTDPAPVEPPITHADDPDVPPGMACRTRNVWRPDLHKYKEYKVCSPQSLVASNDHDDDWKPGDEHKWKSKKKGKKGKKSKKHHRQYRGDDDRDDDDDHGYDDDRDDDDDHGYDYDRDDDHDDDDDD